MSIAEAERLHAVAHQAANAARSFEDCWDDSPLTTAVAAVTRARHSSVYRRDEANGAVEWLLRWWRAGDVRSISRDVAALAVTARAAADLQRLDPELVKDSASAVSQFAQRPPTIVPMLHVALMAWALDRLVPERTEQPWPELRAALQDRRFSGVEEPLRLYAAAIAAEDFDASTVVKELVRAIGASPRGTDACVLLWLITAAAERLTQGLTANDTALELLFETRAGFVERLAGEVTDETFRLPELEEFGEPVAESSLVISYLSPFEALLIDFALASPNEAEAWLLYPEAEALFGERARQAEREAERVADRGWRMAGALVATVGLAGGATTWLGLTDLDWKRAVAASLAVMVALLGLGIAALLERAGGLPERFMETVGVLAFTMSALALLNAYNKHRVHPFLSDVTGIVVDVLVGATALLLWIGGATLVRKRERAT